MHVFLKKVNLDPNIWDVGSSNNKIKGSAKHKMLGFKMLIDRITWKQNLKALYLNLKSNFTISNYS